MFNRGHGDRDGVQNFAIIVTDGNSNVNPERTIPNAIDARVKGINVIVVSIGTLLNMLELRGLASMPIKANMHEAKSWRNLESMPTPIIKNMCDGKI